jgi:nicotinate-nucleotide adenylyltransferase
MKQITALFGGSYDPPHEGHFGMGSYIHEALRCPNQVCFSFSTNRFKDPAKYAPLEHRMEMWRILARHYSDRPFIMTDLEQQLGTNRTYEVLTALRERYPQRKFIWVMGADNLTEFHNWDRFEDILENFCVAVLNRPPYTECALKSYTALTYPHLRIDCPADLAKAENGWCFMDNPLIDMSSTHILNEMRTGRRKFSGPFQEVANHICLYGLYGITPPAAIPPFSLQPAPEILL